MIIRDIRKFVDRDWASVRENKDAYWGERIARLGPAEGLRIGDELRKQALCQDRLWPDAADRQQDLLAHVRLTGLLRRAGAARRR